MAEPTMLLMLEVSFKPNSNLCFLLTVLSEYIGPNDEIEQERLGKYPAYELCFIDN
jgi:hypothetical protein